MDRKKVGSFDMLRSKLARKLRAASGSLVLATTVVASQPTAAAVPPAGDAGAIDERARAVRTELADEAATPERAAEGTNQLAWWGNWHNWGGHPFWHNWPNWRNWHNWPNWGNF